MKKLYNVIFPIWLILVIPPILLITLPSNFIIDSLVLLITLKLLKIDNIFDEYKQSILKVWIFGFIVDIFGSLLLLITQFIGNNEYLYENLIYPLMWNPFKTIIAFIYVLIVVIICGLLIYLINYKFSFKKNNLDNRNKKIISIMLGLITAPYLFFLPTGLFYTSNTVDLNEYQDTYIGDNSKVGAIINEISSGAYLKEFSLDTGEKPYGIIINYKDDIYGNIYMDIERDALILFKLIKNIDYVEFNISDKKYTFDSNYINSIFENIKEIELHDINIRYGNEYFNNYIYLGHIGKYDIFDTSTYCSENKNLIYSDSNYNYFIMCSTIDNLYLIDNENKIELKKAIDEKLISIDDLFNIDLKIVKENK